VGACGSGTYGRNGGSGVVVLSYPSSYPTLTAISGLGYSYADNGTNKIYTFTSGSGTVTI
jgi:hypothetical protein